MTFIAQLASLFCFVLHVPDFFKEYFMKQFSPVAYLSAVTLVVGCRSHVPEYSALQNLTTAPPKVREAAAGVVKIVAPGPGGTGFFTSKEGLLFTNNHVIGSANCPEQGCHIELRFDYEVGKPS